MSVNIEIDVKDLAKLDILEKQFPKETNLAMVKSINRSLTHARKEIAKEVTQEFKIASTPVKKTMVLKKANYSNPSGEIVSTGLRLRMGLFPHTKSRVTKRGVVKPPQITIKKGMKKELPRNFFTFDSRVTGKNEVFKRDNKGRYGYGYGFTVSIPQMISDIDGEKGAYPRIRESTERQFNKEFNHEVEYRLGDLVNMLNYYK